MPILALRPLSSPRRLSIGALATSVLALLACTPNDSDPPPRMNAGTGGKGVAGAAGKSGAAGGGGASAGAGGSGLGGTAGLGGMAGQGGAAGKAGVGGFSGGGVGLETAPVATTLGTLEVSEPLFDAIDLGDDGTTVGLGGSGLTVLDLRDPAQPKTVATLALGAQAVAAAWDDAQKRLFVVDLTNTLHAISLADRRAPRSLATVSVPSGPRAIAVTGDRVYVANASSVLPIAAVLSEGTLSLEPRPAITLTGDVRAIAIGGSTLRVLVGAGDVTSFALGNGSTAPVPLGTAALGGNAFGFVARGQRLVTVLADQGLRVFDLSVPTAATTVFAESSLIDPTFVRRAGPSLVVGLARNLVASIDLTDVTAPRVLRKSPLPVGEILQFTASVGGNTVLGYAKTVVVDAVPPFVAARVPGPTQKAFPRGGRLPVTLNKLVDVDTVKTVGLSCGAGSVDGTAALGVDGRTITFFATSVLPANATCKLTLGGLRDRAGEAVANEDETIVTGDAEPTAITIPKSAFPHVGDGAFTGFPDQAPGYEWSDVTSAKGMYSHFSADYDGERLWLLNDWFFAGEDIRPDCYNQFQVTTGNGADRWEIRAYGDQRIAVWKNEQPQSLGSGEVKGGYGFVRSPAVDTEHTVYELGITTAPGAWSVALHDPGPTFACEKLHGEPTRYEGTLVAGGGATLDPTGAVTLPTAVSDLVPEANAKDVSLGASLRWTPTSAAGTPEAWLVEVGRGSDLGDVFFTGYAYRRELRLPQDTLLPGQTYTYRVRPFNAAGVGGGTSVTFTTREETGAGGAGGAGGGSGGAGGSGAGGVGGAGGGPVGYCGKGGKPVPPLPGCGNFTTLVETPQTSITGTPVVAFDFTGDGFDDVALATNDGQLAIIRSFGSMQPGFFSTTIGGGASNYSGYLTAGDMDNDGVPDFAHQVTKQPDSRGTATFFSRCPDISFTNAEVAPRTFDGGNNPLGIGDVNGDGYRDVVSVESAGDTGGLLVIPNNEDQTFGTPVLSPTGITGGKPIVADLDGDGDGDVALVDGGSSKLSIWLYDKANAKLVKGWESAAGYESFSLWVAEIDGKPGLDLVVPVQGSFAFRVLANKGDGTFTEGASISTVGLAQHAAIFDANGDGANDVAIASPVGFAGAGAIAIHTNLKNGSFERKDYPISAAPTGIVSGDFNGDGRPDLFTGGSTKITLLNTCP